MKTLFSQVFDDKNTLAFSFWQFFVCFGFLQLSTFGERATFYFLREIKLF